MFTRAAKLHESLEAYVGSHFVVNAGHSAESGCYTFVDEANPNARIHVGGVIGKARKHHYPHFKKSAGKRRGTLVKGSSAKQGVQVHKQLGESFIRKPAHRMARAILEYWKARGETLQASEVPCFVDSLRCITQADCITVNERGALTLYEIKTGFPVGGFRKQGTLRNIPGQPQVPNTVMNHWQLQLRYTQLGLQAAGVSVHRACVLQVYDYKGGELKIKEMAQPKWAFSIS